MQAIAIAGYSSLRARARRRHHHAASYGVDGDERCNRTRCAAAVRRTRTLVAVTGAPDKVDASSAARWTRRSTTAAAARSARRSSSRRRTTRARGSARACGCAARRALLRPLLAELTNWISNCRPQALLLLRCVARLLRGAPHGRPAPHRARALQGSAARAARGRARARGAAAHLRRAARPLRAARGVHPVLRAARERRARGAPDRHRRRVCARSCSCAARAHDRGLAPVAARTARRRALCAADRRRRARRVRHGRVAPRNCRAHAPHAARLDRDARQGAARGALCRDGPAPPFDRLWQTTLRTATSLLLRGTTAGAHVAADDAGARRARADADVALASLAPCCSTRRAASSRPRPMPTPRRRWSPSRRGGAAHPPDRRARARRSPGLAVLRGVADDFPPVDGWGPLSAEQVLLDQLLELSVPPADEPAAHAPMAAACARVPARC